MRGKLVFALMILSIVFLVGCQPPGPGEPAVTVETSTTPEPAAAPTPAPEPVAEPTPEPAVTPAPVDNIPTPAKTGINIEKSCYDLVTEQEFASICGTTPKLSHRISEGSCWVNIADKSQPKLTGGLTAVDWRKATEANREFDRGVTMRRTQGAVEGTAVGERSYEYEELDRHNVVWVKGSILTRLGAMTDLCPADKLLELAQSVSGRLQ